MVVSLYQIVAGLYLIASVAAAAGYSLSHPGLARVAVSTLVLGWGLHVLGFATLHTLDPAPQLTDPGVLLSFMACVGVGAFLLLLRRRRLLGLVAFVAPLAFISVFFGQLRFAAAGDSGVAPPGLLEHAHVLLASAGLALLALGSLAGELFLVEHRRLKRKRGAQRGGLLPSLEALDRASSVALLVGFSLLSLGVVSGGIWIQRFGSLSGSAGHELAFALFWVVYAGLVVQRFGARASARQCAIGSVTGFVLLMLGLLGSEWLS
ncbi:MAG: cytochrome c biogenesis protein CcsA [Myxococcota bacterium]